MLMHNLNVRSLNLHITRIIHWQTSNNLVFLIVLGIKQDAIANALGALFADPVPIPKEFALQ